MFEQAQLDEVMEDFFRRIQERKARQPEPERVGPQITSTVVSLQESQDGIVPTPEDAMVETPPVFE